MARRSSFLSRRAPALGVRCVNNLQAHFSSNKLRLRLVKIGAGQAIVQDVRTAMPSSLW
jgi:hypothetical protein